MTFSCGRNRLNQNGTNAKALLFIISILSVPRYEPDMIQSLMATSPLPESAKTNKKKTIADSLL